MASKAVLIVTGAWHLPEHYIKLTRSLKSHGLRVICPCLPTNSDPNPPTNTIQDDISSIQDVVQKEISAGTQLTVIAHSYGGVVSTAALAPFAVDPSSNKGGVISILYMTAFLPLENMSLSGMFGGHLPPYVVDTGRDTMIWDDPVVHLYNDCTEEDATWAETLRRPEHSKIAQDTAPECKKAAWRVIRSSYLICENDAAIPSFVQEMMVENARKSGGDIKIFRCQGGHSPFISVPDEVAQIALRIVEG